MHMICVCSWEMMNENYKKTAGRSSPAVFLLP